MLKLIYYIDILLWLKEIYFLFLKFYLFYIKFLINLILVLFFFDWKLRYYMENIVKSISILNWI